MIYDAFRNRTGDLCRCVFGAMEVRNIALYYWHPTQRRGGGGGFEMNGNYFKTNRYAVHIQLVLLSFAVVEFSGDLP